MGAWNGGVVLLGKAAPLENAQDVPEAFLRSDRRESGPLKGPLLLTRCEGDDVMNFGRKTTKDGSRRHKLNIARLFFV